MKSYKSNQNRIYVDSHDINYANHSVAVCCCHITILFPTTSRNKFRYIRFLATIVMEQRK